MSLSYHLFAVAKAEVETLIVCHFFVDRVQLIAVSIFGFCLPSKETFNKSEINKNMKKRKEKKKKKVN